MKLPITASGFLLALVQTAAAQSVLIPSEVTPPAARTPAASQSPAAGEVPSAISMPPKELKWGPVIFHPHLAYRFVYGNGIQPLPGSQSKTIIQSLSPGIALDLGEHWDLDYTATASFYSSDEFKDTVNHFITFGGNADYDDWGFQLRQTCSLTSEPNVETAAQTDQEIYLTVLSATYQINSVMFLDLGAQQNLRFASGTGVSNPGSKTWSTMDWLNYQWGGGNLITAIGGGVGFVAVDSGSDSTFEHLQGRFMWRAADKISLSVHGGGEIRQFANGPTDVSDNLVNPIYGVALSYYPFEHTELQVAVDRTVSATLFANLMVESTVLTARLSQRLFERYYLGLSGGYHDSSYPSIEDGFPITRSDQYSFFGVSLSTGFLTRGNVSLFYSYSENTSDVSGFGYTSDQVGFQITYRY